MGLTDYIAYLNSRPGLEVLYTCSCNKQRPLEELFFCSDACDDFVCDTCSTHVIDTYYCPSCLNSVFSSKAFEGQNKCRQCAACPSCNQTLVNVARTETEYLLVCEFCKWSSDEISLVGSSLSDLFANLIAHDEKNDAATEFALLQKLYGAKGDRQKATIQEAEERRPDGASYDVLAAVGKIEAKLELKSERILPAEAVMNEGVEAATDTNGVCTFQQRLTHPHTQASNPDQLWPSRVALCTKQGHRCPRCEKFVIKPKAGANKTTFDIHQIAMAVVPRVFVGQVGEMKTGEASTVLLYFKNPQEAPMNLTFSPLTAEGSPTHATTASVVVPSEPITLTPYDEVAERSGVAPKAEEEKSLAVVSREFSKAGIKFEVTPSEDRPVQFAFMVHTTSKSKEISFPVHVNLGST